MADNSFLGVENAVNSSTTFRKNYTTSTPSQQAGYEATNLRDEHLGITYRGAAADADYTTVLARFDDTYDVGVFGALGHNLSAPASWRRTWGTESVRPVWSADGVDDVGSTSAAIPQHADFTLLMRGFFHPSSIDGETANGIPIFLLDATNERLRIGYRAANVSDPLALWVQLTHNGSAVAEIIYDLNPDTSEKDLAVTYDDTGRALTLYIDGVSVGADTASGAWVDEGAQSVQIAKDSTADYVPHGYRNIALYDSEFSAAQVSAYGHKILSGNERGLVWAAQFLEGTGTSVADVMGNAGITLTGGTWEDRANTLSGSNSGILEAVGQWRTRQGLKVTSNASGSGVDSPVLGAATRDITLACVVRIDPDDVLGTNTIIASYGPTVGGYEIRFAVSTAGILLAQASRTSAGTVSTASAIDDGVTRAFVATLKADSSTQSTLTLYSSTDGITWTTVGTATTGAYDAVASCILSVGLRTASASSALFGSVRLFGSARTPSSVDITGPVPRGPDLIEALEFNGSVESLVDSSRSYSTANITYETIANINSDRAAPGREGLGYPYTSGRDRIEAELLDFVQNADESASEVFLEVWNADSYLELGALCCWATVRFEENRITGAERSWKARRALRTDVGGVPYLDDSWEAMTGRMQLRYLNIIDEQDEAYRRILRGRRDKLVCLVLEPTRLVGASKVALPQHLLVDHCVIGTLSASTDTVKEGSDRHVELDIEVEGVRRQTS